jgi:ATP-dependent protease HslVU (ClpYQ) peptidase subunit
MTVIAYSARHRVMAADSRTCLDSMHVTNAQKIVRLKSGALLGMAGDGDCRDFARLLGKVLPKRLPTRDELADLRCDVTSLLVLPSGEVYRVTVGHTEAEYWGEVMLLTKTLVAIGSGSDLALGAMGAGADPKRAVEVACEWAVSCGGPVQVEPLIVAAKAGKR